MLEHGMLALVNAQCVFFPLFPAASSFRSPPNICLGQLSLKRFGSLERVRLYRPVSSRFYATLADQSDGRRYLAVPYVEKDQAKALGAKWDPAAKSWYDPGPGTNAQLDKWKKDPSIPTIVPPVLKVDGRKYLKVPFADKDEAKSLGAKWDKQAKLWYDPTGTNEALSKWSE